MNQILKLSLFLAEKIDAFAWKNFRCYRRREIRKRLGHVETNAPILRCEICECTVNVVVLRNGAQICPDCREGFKP
jgi:hypothetical protein